MQLQDLIESIRSAYNTRLEQEANRIILVAANDVAAKISNRVITTGKDHKGGSFSSYSTRYKDKRDRLGRQTVFKDFQISEGRNTMWANYGMMKVYKEGLVIKADIGGLTDDARKKLAVTSWYETKIKGGEQVAEISATEQKEYEDYVKDKFVDFFKNVMNGR